MQALRDACQGLSLLIELEALEMKGTYVIATVERCTAHEILQTDAEI